MSTVLLCTMRTRFVSSRDEMMNRNCQLTEYDRDRNRERERDDDDDDDGIVDRMNDKDEDRRLVHWSMLVQMN